MVPPPSGVDDNYWLNSGRERKLSVVLHSEENAILHCRDLSLDGYTIYVWPLPPCCHCASVIAQSGISRVVCSAPEEGSRWQGSTDVGRELLEDAGVEVVWMDR